MLNTLIALYAEQKFSLLLTSFTSLIPAMLNLVQAEVLVTSVTPVNSPGFAHLLLQRKRCFVKQLELFKI